MVFATITRASSSARLRRFESLDWNCVSRLLRDFSPPAPPARMFSEQSPPGLEAAVNEEPFDFQHGDVPAQPGDLVPAFGGPVSEAASQQPGFRMPGLAKKASPVRAAAVDFGLRRVLDGAWFQNGGSGSWLQKIRVSS